MRTGLFLLIAALAVLVACAPQRAGHAQDLVRIQTYLSTPQRNATIDARAAERCLGRGQSASYVETIASDTGLRAVYTHIYACESA